MISGKKMHLNWVGAALLAGLATLLPMHQAYAAGPVKIKWIKTCGSNDWSHSRWVVGLSDGVKIAGWYNPGQGRSATYSMLLTAFTSGQNFYYENGAATTETACGVAVNFIVDPSYLNSTSIMMGNP